MECGIKVELVPWAYGKHTITHHYAKYLADWAKEMSWKSVANRFQTSWQTVYRAVEGMNRKINLTIRKTLGFRSYEVMEVAVYHQLGKLPEPVFTHEF